MKIQLGVLAALLCGLATIGTGIVSQSGNLGYFNQVAQTFDVYPINGQCGTAIDSCYPGTFTEVTDTSTEYKWYCQGSNGGTGMPCSYPKDTPYLTCPFTKSSNSYLIDFTQGGTRSQSNLTLLANSVESSATLSYGNISIPAGIYKVDVATYWKSSITQTYPYQQWKLRFYLTDNTEKSSSPTKDQSNASDQVMETSDTNLTLPIATKEVDGIHAYYPQSQGNIVVPLCAMLTYIGPVPTAPTPNASSTKQDGKCDTTKVNCLSGDRDPLPDTTTEYRWYCRGVNGGTDSPLCTLLKQSPSATSTPINGKCDTTAAYRCSSGTSANKFEYATQYVWDCVGSNGGTTAFKCAFPKPTSLPINGACDTTAEYRCKPGTVINKREQLTQYLWDCAGSHGGTTVTNCAYPRSSSPVSTDDNTKMLIVNNEVVYDKPDDGEVLRTQAIDLGLQVGDAEITLPKEVIEVRREIVGTTQTQPFTLLKDAPPLQREELVRTWLEKTLPPTASSSGPSATPTPRVFTRTAQEPLPKGSTPTEEPPQEQIEKIKNRAGLATLRDRDGDGISDYDEEHIYGTDPKDPFTADSIFSDGERVILGMNPLTDDIEPVIVDSPKIRGGATDDTLYSIDSIELVQETREDTVDTPVTQGIRVRGRAQPLAFVTLYIYSTPIIVTVQADASGRFDYALDTTLEDGTHEVYVASVNNSGKILAQSSPIPFVKTAQAIEYTPASVSGADPVDSATQLMLTLTFLLTLLIAGAVIVWIGMRHAHAEAEQTNENNSL